MGQTPAGGAHQHHLCQSTWIERIELPRKTRSMVEVAVRSYAYVLSRWWRWLLAVEVPWDRASSTDVRDLVLWLSRASKPDCAGKLLPSTPVAHGEQPPDARSRTDRGKAG